MKIYEVQWPNIVTTMAHASKCAVKFTDKAKAEAFKEELLRAALILAQTSLDSDNEGVVKHYTDKIHGAFEINEMSVVD